MADPEHFAQPPGEDRPPAVVAHRQVTGPEPAPFGKGPGRLVRLLVVFREHRPAPQPQLTRLTTRQIPPALRVDHPRFQTFGWPDTGQSARLDRLVKVVQDRHGVDLGHAVWLKGLPHADLLDN